MRDSKLLLVVDESIASKRALDYVSGIVAWRQDVRVCMTHALPSLPPELREISIVNDREQENLRHVKFKAEQKKSILTAEKKVQPVLDWASDLLCKAGLAAEAIETTICYPADGLAATGEILETAREHKCQTIVMGRESLSWLRGIYSRRPCGGTCPPRQRIHDLGCGIKPKTLPQLKDSSGVFVVRQIVRRDSLI